ncbi:MAG TPA: tyrosine-type recombinase/integrase [Coleofasciculaceae cyanobacterium]
MNQTITIQSKLQRCLDAKIGQSFKLNSIPDVLSQLLADKRSPNTRLAYEKDVTLFFQWAASTKPTKELVLEFLHLEQPEAIALVLDYKAHLLNKGLSEATTNRRIAAIKSLVQMGRKLGHCAYSLEDVRGEKVEKYRDTSGIPPETFKKVLALCGDSSQGKRDYAILRLLWDNALRRNEIVQCNIGDFDPIGLTIAVLGKGKGSQKQTIDLAPVTVQAIAHWLDVHPNLKPNQPLFTALTPNYLGHRLTGESIRRMVDRLCQQAGVGKQMSPHRIRHSSITTALNVSGGDIRKVQKLSRHSKIETVLIYDDARHKDQLELSHQLADLV